MIDGGKFSVPGMFSVARQLGCAVALRSRGECRIVDGACE
jgi:hypothetical protein